MKIKIFIYIIFIFILTGCAKLPEQREYIHLKNVKKEKFDLIYDLSKKCFEKEPTFFSQRILVQAKKEEDRGYITLHRYDNKSLFNTSLYLFPPNTLNKPFVILYFYTDKILIEEYPSTYEYKKYVKTSIKTQIEKWLKGETTCK